MKYYRQYMDRQAVSADLHRRLLAIPESSAPRPARWRPVLAAAACCVLIVGAALGLPRLRSDGVPGPADQVSMPDGGTAEDAVGFLVEGSGETMMFPAIPYVAYPETKGPAMTGSIALPEGAFLVSLPEEQVSRLLWGGERPEGADSVPWMLGWEGCFLSASAWYDGGGDLWEMVLHGSREGAAFTLRLAPGALPPAGTVVEGTETTLVNGVEVTGWKSVYDRDGDGAKEAVYESAFLANGVGVRAQFESEEDSLLSDLWIRWCTGDSGISLDHLLRAEEIPGFRSRDFADLEEARQEADYAPYLPEEAPAGYTDDFYGHLTWQEGRESRLVVLWSRGYDDVRVLVTLPEDAAAAAPVPVDPAAPESYDVRLYGTPWADTVPAEYQADFLCPAFRAEDMCLALVEARAIPRDTGGDQYLFQVLHPNGVLVEYDCSGLTAEQVWAMVEATLD